MFEITSLEIINYGRSTTGGDRFTLFVDELIKTHCSTLNIPRTDILTTLRVNISDGGVDTQINSGKEYDSEGLFQTPTVWQY